MDEHQAIRVEALKAAVQLTGHIEKTVPLARTFETYIKTGLASEAEQGAAVEFHRDTLSERLGLPDAETDVPLTPDDLTPT